MPKTSQQKKASANHSSVRSGTQTKLGKKKKTVNGMAFREDAPAARAFRMTRSLGLQDVEGLQISYLSGYLYVGNNTLGNNLSVYFVDSAGTHVFTSPVPLSPSDAAIGQSYVADVFKHFMRRRYRSIKLHCLSLQPNTTNNMVANVAPVRGGAITASVSTTTGSALAQAGVMGMKGHQQFPVWDGATYDLTPYIAGGSGSAQNEFNQSQSAAVESIPSAASLSLASPCGFAVSGSAITSTLEGENTHAVIIEMVVDLLDFVASILPGGTVNDPKSTRFQPNDLCSSSSSQLTKIENRDEKSQASIQVQTASSRLAPIDEGYVAIQQPSPLGGPPLRDPTRIESRRL